jgi:adenylylsulfate kinase
MEKNNTVWHNYEANIEDREKVLGHQSVLIWLTGLSGSGKSTIANELQKRLLGEGKLAYVLDGDNVRRGLNKDLSFSAEERRENIRRIKEVANLFVDAGVITLAAFISPYSEDRNHIRAKLGEKFVEVHVHCDLETCAERDPKGLYQKAKSGEIKNFTGISAPYEAPENPELLIDTSKMEVSDSVNIIYDYLKTKEII